MFSEPIFYSDTKLSDRFIFKNKRLIFKNQSIIFNFYTYKFDFKIEEVIVAKDFFRKGSNNNSLGNERMMEQCKDRRKRRKQKIFVV